MKKVLLLASLFSIFSGFSQKTVQFSDPLPPNSTGVKSTDKVNYGTYRDGEVGPKYVIDESGISLVSVAVMSVTREQVRESGTLRVSGDYLFGVKGKDSVPCVLEGENYYYGIEQKLVITGEGTLNTLTKVSNGTYVINFHEGAYFEPSLVSFQGGKMTIIHPDLKDQAAFSSILQIATITRYGYAVNILAPTFEQWERLQGLLFKGTKLVYSKQI